MVRGFIFSFSTIVLLKVIPEYDEGIFSKSVGFLQAINAHRKKHKKGMLCFMKFYDQAIKKVEINIST
jgi:hypothetical protein